MPERTLTHKDLAARLKVSETTIKSYRRKFADCIPVASQGKPIRFTQEAGKVCLRIRDLFAEGMSVPEVRARLAEEFSWISLVTPEPQEEEPVAVALPEEFTVSVSNLARSMVTLTQQQGGILKRLQHLEGAPGPSQAPATVSFDVALLAESLAPLERLEQLDALREVSSLVAALHQATAALTDAAEALREAAEKIPDQASGGTAAEGGAATPRVVRFPSPRSAAPAALPEENPAAQEQPPRHLLSLPLVIRTTQGQYVGAGGRTRGRFTLNDLKALLAYTRADAGQYAMHWELTDGAWWLVLDQPEAEEPRCLRLSLRELSSQRGMTVAEIVQLVDGEQTVHPAEFCGFVEHLMAGNQG